MTTFSKKAGPAVFAGAAWAALQWRLLVLWVICLLLPTAIVGVPLFRALDDVLGRTVHAEALAQRFDVVFMSDVISLLGRDSSWLGGAVAAGLLATLLLSPFLAAMAIASGRAGRPLPFGHLMQGGIVEYGRMFRLMLWSLVPYAVVAFAAKGIFGLAEDYADKAVLQSQADLASHLALAGVAIVFVLAQVVVEAARAQFIADIGLRSATRALGRGLRQLLRRPLATLLVYLLVTAIGYGLFTALGMARMRTTPASLASFLLALLLVQLGVAVLGWMRTARLFTLAEVAASQVGPRRRRSDFASAL